MIIERKYVKLGVLYETDLKSKEIIDEAFKKSNLSVSEKRRIFEKNYSTTIYNWEMGCGLPNPGIIREGMEKLDITNPYDNGLSFEDIRDFDIVWKEKDYIHYLLLTNYGDIVQSIEEGVQEF